MTTVLILLFAVLPFVVILVILGAVVALVRGAAGAALRRLRGGSVPDRDAAPAIARLAGASLRPVENVGRVGSKAFLLVAAVVVSARMGIWNDGLVDARARVVSLETLCLAAFAEAAPLSITEYLTISQPRPCPDDPTGRATRVEGVRLAVPGADGSLHTAYASRAQLGAARLEPGSEITLAHAAGDPAALARHPAEAIAVAPETALLIAFVAALFGEAVGWLRRRLGDREPPVPARRSGSSPGGVLRRPIGGSFGSFDLGAFARSAERRLVDRRPKIEPSPRRAPGSETEFDPERIARVLARNGRSGSAASDLGG